MSHETIYRSLFIQARGVLKKELLAHLRRGQVLRYGGGHRSKVGKGRGAITEAVSIRERPAEVEDRAVPGHWEGDLLCGPPGTQIATLVERHSRFVMLVKLPTKESARAKPWALTHQRTNFMLLLHRLVESAVLYTVYTLPAMRWLREDPRYFQLMQAPGRRPRWPAPFLSGAAKSFSAYSGGGRRQHESG